MEDTGRLESRRVYTGRVLNLDIDRVRFPDGSTGELEMIRHPGASAVVPLLDSPEVADPRVVLIRQYRYAANDFVYEVPAGRLDGAEDPAACATRELEEEAGYRAGHLERLVTILTTPGFTDERIHLFLAWDLTQGDARREPDEFISLHEVSLSRAVEMTRAGEIQDAKTVIALLFAAFYCRDR
ncbi:MAG: NUDIX hydrolase [Gemmatimonadota bacterium]